MYGEHVVQVVVEEAGRQVVAGAVARQVNTGAFPDRLQLFDTRMDISYDVVSILKVAVISTRIYGPPRSFLAGLGRCSGVV